MLIYHNLVLYWSSLFNTSLFYFVLPHSRCVSHHSSVPYWNYSLHLKLLIQFLVGLLSDAFVPAFYTIPFYAIILYNSALFYSLLNSLLTRLSLFVCLSVSVCLSWSCFPNAIFATFSLILFTSFPFFMIIQSIYKHQSMIPHLLNISDIWSHIMQLQFAEQTRRRKVGRAHSASEVGRSSSALQGMAWVRPQTSPRVTSLYIHVYRYLHGNGAAGYITYHEIQ